MIENIKKLDEEKLRQDRDLNGHCHKDHGKSRSTAPASRFRTQKLEDLEKKHNEMLH